MGKTSKQILKMTAPKTLRDREFESSRALILEALRRNGNSVVAAAAALSVSRTTLWRRCKRLKISIPDPPAR
jgi:transcriptional regulator with PAS, ATPase and Fis domain